MPKPQNFTINNLGKIGDSHPWSEVRNFMGAAPLSNLPKKQVQVSGTYPLLMVKYSWDNILLFNQFDYNTWKVYFQFPEGLKDIILITRIFNSMKNALDGSGFSKIIYVPTVDGDFERQIITGLGFGSDHEGSSLVYPLMEKSEYIKRKKEFWERIK